MRYKPGHKEEIRARIVDAAAHMLRERGLAGVSIPNVMRAVGLTHGGFYAHFDSRDELLVEAVRAAAESTQQGAIARNQALQPFLDSYLSPEHAAHPEGGCVVAAVGSESIREAPDVREAFDIAARRLLHTVQARLPQPNPMQGGGGTASGETTDISVTPEPLQAASFSDEALSIAARMVGAMMLSRIVNDDELSRRLLEVARTLPVAREE
jgi:TetR/AcrR family transcriptional regulator, transcriptional repressor for nem operon